MGGRGGDEGRGEGKEVLAVLSALFRGWERGDIRSKTRPGPHCSLHTLSFWTRSLPSEAAPSSCTFLEPSILSTLLFPTHTHCAADRSQRPPSAQAGGVGASLSAPAKCTPCGLRPPRPSPSAPASLCVLGVDFCLHPSFSPSIFSIVFLAVERDHGGGEPRLFPIKTWDSWSFPSFSPLRAQAKHTS